jgi:hypothetical protein
VKGRGPFIAGRWLDNYKLIYFYIHNRIYMTSGSSLEIVSLKRSVGCFHGVRAYSGVFMVMWWTVLENVPNVAAMWGRLCFTAKSPWWPVRMGWLAPYSYLGPMAFQIRGQGAFPSFIFSYHARMVNGVLLVCNPWPLMLMEVLTT